MCLCARESLRTRVRPSFPRKSKSLRSFSHLCRMKKLKDSQIRGIEEARQRLAELEKKHAKALKELQRAEKVHVKTSRRRRTFHGYPKSDCGKINEAASQVPESSSITPDQPQDQKISDKPSLKLQLRGPRKGLGLPQDTSASPKLANPADQVYNQSVGEVITINTKDCRKIAKDVSENSSGLYSSISKSAKHDTKKSDGYCSVPDMMKGENKVVAVKNKEQKKRRKVHTYGTSPKVHALVGSEPCTKKVVPNNRISMDVHNIKSLFQDNNEERHVSTETLFVQPKKMLPIDDDSLRKGAVDKKTVQGNVHYEKDDNGGKVDINLSTDSSGACEVIHHPDSDEGTLQELSLSLENSQKNISNHDKKDHWRHLFEEEVPRRSPRLKSKKGHEINMFGGQPSNLSKTCQNKPTTSISSSPKENIEGSFPRPPVELTMNGGPLSVIADFSLPDKEFAKWKLDKIRGISNNVNVKDQHSGQKFRLDHERGDLPGQQKADNNSMYSRKSAFCSRREFRNGISSGLTEGHSTPIHECSSNHVQPTRPQELSGELIQERVDGSHAFNDPLMGLLDQQPLQTDASGNASQRFSHFKRQVSVDEVAKGNLHEVKVHPTSAFERRTLSEEPSTESRSDTKCALNPTRLIVDSGCSGQSKENTGDPNLLELQEMSQSVSDMEQLFSKLPSDDLSLTGDKNPPLPCSETEAKPVKSLGHLSSCTTAFNVSTLLAHSDGVGSGAVFPEQQCQQRPDATISPLIIRPTFVQKGVGSFGQAVTLSKENTKVNDESNAHLSIQPGVQEAEGDPTGAEALKHGNKKDATIRDVLTKSLVPDSKDNLTKYNQSKKDEDALVALIQYCVKDEGNSTNAGNLPNQSIPNEKDDTFQSVIQPKGCEAFSNAEELPDNLKERGRVKDQRESSETFVPVLMQSCLEHGTEGMDNAVRAIALTTYECSSCHEMQVEKMEAVVVCQAHVLVIWTAVPGQEWTVHHRWTLASDGPEEFCSVQLVSSSSHLIVLTGGFFCTGYGRIYGCSEEAKYCMDLHVEQDLVTDHFSFAAMCMLNEHTETVLKEEADVDLVLGATGSTGILVTKWTLDSLCLIIKESKPLPMVNAQERLSSLCAVHGNSCLLLGTAGKTVLLWNHTSSELLRSINCRSLSLGNLTCLTAVTQMGLLFLTVLSCPESQSKRNGECLLLAVNPNTNRISCLDNVAAKQECSFTVAAAWGQYVALGQQQGDACLWNISSSQHDVQLSVSEDVVRSIGFHQHRPLVAFGSQTGCVHIFSLC